MYCRAVMLASVISLSLASVCHAQSTLDSLVPAGASNCTVKAPPDQAGLVVTPGGFLMVFPRNDALGERYTGCKILWMVETDRTARLATLYFEHGQLSRAIAHDVRDTASTVTGACAFPGARSLRPTAGARFNDSACAGLTREEIYGLRLATWPRSCLTTPDAKVCKDDPR